MEGHGETAEFTVIDYDQETKAWFTAVITGQSLSGTITGKENPELNVDLTPVPVKDGIDVNVYKIAMTVAPQVNQADTLKLASGSTRTVVKSWGAVSVSPAPGLASG